MKKHEVAELLMRIHFLYPNQFNIDESEFLEAVDAWYGVLGKQDYAATIDRLNRYAAENKFPPAPADLYIKRHAAYESNILEQIQQWEREAVGKQC
jgi:Loader and inhibitor of phage G40P